MKDLTEQIYDELNAQVVRMLNHSLNQASRIVELETQLKDHSAQAFSIGETYATALSRITELEAQLEEAETLISQTSHGAAERISAMEAQLADALSRERTISNLLDAWEADKFTGNEVANAIFDVLPAAPVQQKGE